MVNDINGLNPTTTQSSAGKKAGRVDAVGAENQTTAESTQDSAADSFKLSSQAQLLSQLEAKISELPEVDQDRVNALRDALNKGQFEIDSFNLAQDIINFEFK